MAWSTHKAGDSLFCDICNSDIKYQPFISRGVDGLARSFNGWWICGSATSNVTENSFEPAESSLRFIPPLRSYTSCLGGTQDNMQTYTAESARKNCSPRVHLHIGLHYHALAMLKKVLAANCLFRSLLITNNRPLALQYYSPDDINTSTVIYLIYLRIVAASSGML